VREQVKRAILFISGDYGICSTICEEVCTVAASSCLVMLLFGRGWINNFQFKLYIFAARLNVWAQQVTAVFNADKLRRTSLKVKRGRRQSFGAGHRRKVLGVKLLRHVEVRDGP